MTHIVKFHAENFMGLKVVDLEPSDFTVIAGKNGQGKSSILNGVVAAFEGKKGTCDVPVRKGEAKATLVVETDEVKIERIISPDGSQKLKVSTKDGIKVSSAQSYLNGYFGSLSFDVSQFLRERPEEQANIAREAAGVDFAELDKKRKTVFDNRTDVNREAKSLKARLGAAEYFEDAPKSETSVAELNGKLDEMRTVADSNARSRRESQSVSCAAEGAQEKVQEQQEEINRLEDELVKAREQMVELRKLEEIKSNKARSLHESAAKLVDPDMSAIKESIRTCEDTNRKVRANKEHGAIRAQHGEAVQQSESLTAQLDSIDAEKAKMIADSSLPIDGLVFDGSGMQLDGLPFSQINTAEKMRVAVLIAMAQNPKLRVLFVRNGGDFDEESLETLRGIAEQHGVQIWLELPGPGDDKSIVIEDGRVVGEANA